MGWDPFGNKAAKKIKAAAAQAAAAAREAAAAQAEAYRFNAGVYHRNADVVEQQSLIDEARQRRAGNRYLGEQAAAIAGSGFDNTTGFGGVREFTEDELDLDAIIIRRQGQFAAAEFSSQEELALMNADSAIKAGEAAAQGAILNGSIQAAGARSSAITGTLGLGASVGAIAFSDARVKENVQRLGETPNGLGVFAFNYVWSDASDVRVGVMAQEVRQRFPDAVQADSTGILCVDYRKIGLPQGYTLAEVARKRRKAVF